MALTIDRMVHSPSFNMTTIIFSVLAICSVLFVADTEQFGTPQLKPRIVGGDRATDGQFPYQVSLRKVQTGSHMCGASIITNRFLLTAAHCTQFEFATPESLYAVVGTVYPSAIDTKYRYSLDKITPHEHFDSNTIYNDISLLRTAKKIVFNDYIQPIALPTKDTAGNVPAYISGWGRIRTDGPGTNYLKFAKTHTISQSTCYDLHKRFGLQQRIVKTSLCTLERNGNGVCNGDSGHYYSKILNNDSNRIAIKYD